MVILQPIDQYNSPLDGIRETLSHISPDLISSMSIGVIGSSSPAPPRKISDHVPCTVLDAPILQPKQPICLACIEIAQDWIFRVCVASTWVTFIKIRIGQC